MSVMRKLLYGCCVDYNKCFQLATVLFMTSGQACYTHMDAFDDQPMTYELPVG